MIPATFPLQLYRGDSQRWQFKLFHRDQTPVDLTGVLVRSQIRDRPAGGIIVNLECTVILPNIIEVLLTHEESRKLPGSKGVWDLQLTYPSEDVQTPVAGNVTIAPDVTDSTIEPYVEHHQLRAV